MFSHEATVYKTYGVYLPLMIKARIYSGKAQYPSVTIKNGNITQKKDTDYTLKYWNNKNIGSGKVTIVFIGLHLPKGLKSIEASAFSGCSGLCGPLHIPEGLTSIEAYTFRGCSTLFGKLHLPEDLTRIGRGAFYGCSGLYGELCLPEGLKSIGDGVFYNCNAIEKIIFCDPYTEINGLLNMYSSTIICGYRNSTAEEYAKTQGLVFEELKG